MRSRSEGNHTGDDNEMLKKIYSAGLVSKRFWFYEVKQFIELLNEGKTNAEIKALSEEVNIFGAISQSRANEVYGTAQRRISALGVEMQELFPKLNIDNQKIVVLISVLLLNDLFLEFLLEVYQVKVQRDINELSSVDYKAFFSEKQRSNAVVSGWKPYTYNRLGSSYKKYLSESGLIRDNGKTDIITPKVLDLRVIDWLKNRQRFDILKAIMGGE